MVTASAASSLQTLADELHILIQCFEYLCEFVVLLLLFAKLLPDDPVKLLLHLLLLALLPLEPVHQLLLLFKLISLPVCFVLLQDAVDQDLVLPHVLLQELKALCWQRGR
jgi:hypothetical protein